MSFQQTLHMSQMSQLTSGRFVNDFRGIRGVGQTLRHQGEGERGGRGSVKMTKSDMGKGESKNLISLFVIPPFSALARAVPPS